MAKLEPAGLEWMNKGLNDFLDEIKKITKAMGRSAKKTDQVTLSMKTLNKETGKWVKQTADIIKGTEGITVSYKELTHTVDETEDEIVTIDKSFKDMSRTAESTGRRGGGIGILTAAISGLAAAAGVFLLNALKNLVKFGLKALWQALILPVKGFIELGKVVAKIAFAGFRAGAELAKNVLIGIGEAAVWTMRKIAEIGATMLKAGTDFQEGFTGIKKAGTAIVDVAGNITRLGRAVREDFIQLAREIPLAIDELLRIGELGAQLDIPDEYLAEFTRVVAAVTKATVLSAEDAALGFGKIIAVMGLSAEETERLGSVLVWLGNNMGIVEDEILLLSKRITGVAITAGFTADEVLGISAAILRLGATPYAGASAIQQAITRIIVAIAEGNEDLELFAAVAGMSSDDFVAAWKEAPADVFIEFIKGLSLAEEDAVLLLDELGLANIRVTQTFLSAAAAPQELIKALDGSRQAWRDNTALAREAQLRYETVASKIQLLKNQFNILGVRLFDFVEPVIRRIISVGERLIAVIEPSMTKAFERLSPWIKDVSEWFDKLGRAIDYATWIGEDGLSTWEGFTRLILDLFGLDPTLAGPLIETIQDIIGTISGLGEGIDFSTFLASITTGVNTVITWFTDNWEPVIKPKILAAFEWVTTYDWAGLWKTITDTGQLVIDWFVENWPTIKTTVIDTYNEIIDFLLGPKVQDIPGLPPVLGMEEGERIGGFIDGLIEGFDDIKASAIEAGRAIEDEIIPALERTIINIAEMLGMEEGAGPKEAGRFVAGRIANLIDLYTGLFTIAAATAELISGGFPFRYRAEGEFAEFNPPAGEPLFGGEIPAFPDIPVPSAAEQEETLGFFQRIPEVIGTALGAVGPILDGFFSNFLGGFAGFFTELVGNSIIPEGMAAIVAVFETGLAEISALWSTFWTGTTTEASTGIDSFLSVMGVEPGGSSQGLLASIERSYSSFKDAGRSIVRAIADGMLEAAYMMVDALRSNIEALNVAVDTDEAIDDILFDIGEKITNKIATAIIKSYRLIYDALALALALGGGLINQARAAAQEVSQGGGGTVDRIIDDAQQTVTSTAGAAMAPVGGFGAAAVPGGFPIPQGQREPTQININVGSVRDDMDMAAIETVVRRTIAEEIA